MKKFIIYTLQDPFSLAIKYIGLTSQKLNVRLSAHWNTSSNKKSHKVHWINKLKKLNQKPIITELDIAYSLKEACELEIYWIEQFKQWGFYLTNTTLGGEGALGFKPSKEQRKILSKKLSKPILQYDSKGLFVKKWNSILSAAKYFNCKSSTIRHALVDHTRTSNGYFWRYYKKDFSLIISVNLLLGNKIKLKVFDKLSNITTIYNSKQEAFNIIGRPTNPNNYINTDKYFKKQYKLILC